MQETIPEIRQLLEERNWVPKNAASIAKSISIESAELLELFQWDEPTFDDVLADEKRLGKVRGELADVLIYAFTMATYLGLDVDEIVREKLAKQREKYPAHVMSGDGGREAYYAIKDRYRSRE